MQNTPATDLMAAHALAYAPCGFTLSALAAEPESADYGACALVLNGLRIRFRVAKTTPTKTGQFVTLWKRVGGGPIQPFELSDPVDTFVVSTRSGPNFGQFVFPKAVLAAKDVVAKSGQGDKRAIRVYPPWASATSRQAHNTQTWQAAYFIDLSAGKLVDLARVQALFINQTSL
ncbi:MAG: MepB family protein [Rhodoferax sp.]|uniref:MepB family protein n=1 Tax=Rhodoferax sp. TaxID=50421 RepID=UPI002604B383|nr:MepB family protein [Rhodoferax sp.]MDD2878808.1 MepB family protein [Rhodoferax sp.]